MSSQPDGTPCSGLAARLGRLGRLAGTGGTALLIACMTILAAAFFLRALVALVEALAALILAVVVALLIASREWPEGWARCWEQVRVTGLAWIACLHDQFVDKRDDGKPKSDT